MKTFSDEYRNLEERVELAFTEKRKEFETIEFLNDTSDMDDDDYQSALEDCPTTFFNHPSSGEEKHGYVTRIDSNGINIVDSDDITDVYYMGLKDLNGLFYAIDLLEAIDKHLNKTE